MCQITLSTLEYTERPYSTVTLYVVQPDGQTKSAGSSSKGTGTWVVTFDQVGTYILYGEVSNEYGAYRGSTTNSCMRITITEDEPPVKIY